MDLDDTFFEGGCGVSQSTSGLLFESIDGRGQKTICHFGRRLNAVVDGLGQIGFEIGKQHSAECFRDKGRHIGRVRKYLLLVFVVLNSKKD